MSIFKILIFGFLGIACSAERSSGEPIGFYQEVKGNSEYESERRENLYYFYKKDGMIFGKVIGLDNPTENGGLRTCGYCATPPEILSGFDVVQNLKLSSGIYKGKMYDVYNRKWFDVNVRTSEAGTLKLRIYAYIPLFGKNIQWKSGESSYLSLIQEKTEKEPEKFPKNLYALTLGEMQDGKFIFFPGIDINQFQGAYGVWFTKDGRRVEGYREIGKEIQAEGDSLLVFYRKK